MKSYVALSNVLHTPLPAEFAKEDVRYSEALVSHFLNEFTKPGDVILDPFMGYGTTLLVAEKRNLKAFGIEFDEKRWLYVQTILKHPERALHGDSPPYMGKHHTENPFTAYSTQGPGYAEYLRTVADIYRQLAKKLHKSGRAVIEVSNLKHEDGSLTTLAWDIAGAVSEVMRFEGEVIVTWEDHYGYGYDHSYCLVFSKKD